MMLFKVLLFLAIITVVNAACFFNFIDDTLTCFGEDIFLTNNTEQYTARVIVCLDQVPNISTVFTDRLLNHITRYFPLVQEIEYKSRNCSWKPNKFRNIKRFICHQDENMLYDKEKVSFK